MKSYDIVGYVFDSEVFCSDCCTEEEKQEATPVFDGDEVEYQVTCCNCNNVVKEWSNPPEVVVEIYINFGGKQDSKRILVRTETLNFRDTPRCLDELEDIATKYIEEAEFLELNESI